VVGKRGAHEPPSAVNPGPPQDREPQDLDASGSSLDNLVDNSVAFNPASMASGDEFMFDAHEVITNYLETHFRTSLTKDVQTAMHKAHPLPCTPAMQVPKVDRFMLDHLKQKFCKSRDAKLGTIQSALLYVDGPLTVRVSGLTC